MYVCVCVCVLCACVCVVCMCACVLCVCASVVHVWVVYTNIKYIQQGCSHLTEFKASANKSKEALVPSPYTVF